MRISTSFAGAAAAALVFGSAFALPAAAQSDDAAQGNDEMQAEQSGEQAAPDFSDDKLDAFAEVAVDIFSIREDYQAKFAAAEGEEEKQSIAEEGNAAMVAAVEDEPELTMDEYAQIAEAAQGNPDLGQRIGEMIQEKRAQ